MCVCVFKTSIKVENTRLNMFTENSWVLKTLAWMTRLFSINIILFSAWLGLVLVVGLERCRPDRGSLWLHSLMRATSRTYEVLVEGQACLETIGTGSMIELLSRKLWSHQGHHLEMYDLHRSGGAVWSPLQFYICSGPQTKVLLSVSWNWVMASTFRWAHVLHFAVMHPVVLREPTPLIPGGV